MLSKDQKQNYYENGYCIIKSEIILAIKKKIKGELQHFIEKIVKKSQLPLKIKEEALNFYAKNNLPELLKLIHDNEVANQCSKIFYEIFPLSNGILTLSSSDYITKIAKEIGVSTPIPSTAPQVRIDRPSDSRYLTRSHQDLWYSMLSESSITFWFSLFELTDDSGPLKIIPKSHKGKLRAMKEFTREVPYILMDEFNESEYVPVYLADDEMLVFSQKLVHKSGFNQSPYPRISIQIRFNNYDDLKIISSSYVTKYSTTTMNLQRNFLIESKNANKE